jgi:hypothetical protein
MSVQRINPKLRCRPSEDASFEANDWCFVEPLMTAFNLTMQATVRAGWLIGCDESMSAWRGKQGKRDPKKIPQLQFVKRKPEPLGCEFKNSGCALSGIILNMEIMKGPKSQNPPWLALTVPGAGCSPRS